MFKRCSEIGNRFPGEFSTWVLFKTWFWNLSNHSSLNRFFLQVSFENVLIFLIPITGRSALCTQDRACWVSWTIISPPDYSLPNPAPLTCVLLQEHLSTTETHAFMRLSLRTFPAPLGTFSHLCSELEFAFLSGSLNSFFSMFIGRSTLAMLHTGPMNSLLEKDRVFSEDHRSSCFPTGNPRVSVQRVES